MKYVFPIIAITCFLGVVQVFPLTPLWGPQRHPQGTQKRHLNLWAGKLASPSFSAHPKMILGADSLVRYLDADDCSEKEFPRVKRDALTLVQHLFEGLESDVDEIQTCYAPQELHQKLFSHALSAYKTLHTIANHEKLDRELETQCCNSIQKKNAKMLLQLWQAQICKNRTKLKDAQDYFYSEMYWHIKSDEETAGTVPNSCAPQ